MRTQYEGRRIQSHKGTARLNSGRVSRSSLSFRKKSRQQYRKRSKKSKFANCCFDAVLVKSSSKEVEGIAKLIGFHISPREKYQKAETMSRRREYLNATQFDSNSTQVKCVATRNENVNADITSSEIIDFVAKLVHLAAKRGPVKSIDAEVFDEAV